MAGFMDLQEYTLSYLQENIETVAYAAICFFVPFLLGHPQFLVGTIVNCGLVLAALNIRNVKLLPIIALPSLAVLLRGAIFGPFTMFLVFMLPFIWLGNLALVYLMKKMALQYRFNKFLSLAISAAIKAGLLFVAAFILVKLGVLPVVFLTAMGAIQLYTALAGGALALGIQKAKSMVS